MTVYYNEFDPFAASWLRELMKDGLIPAGDVDERSIVEVQPDDLKRYTQCHFFAGIGGWPYALELARWGDRPVWTGSCPCQPFSVAGKGAGAEDPRHLWPAWFRLIRECRPERIFGEQVEGAVGHGWLDLVSTDLEAEGYAVGAAVLGAHSVGTPHRRQRLYFVAESQSVGRRGRGDGHSLGAGTRSDSETQVAGPSGAGFVAESQYTKRGAISLTGVDGRDRANGGREEAHGESGTCGEVHHMADTERGRCEQRDPTERGVPEPDQIGATGDMADSLPTGRAEGRPESGNGPTPDSGADGYVADAEGTEQQGIKPEARWALRCGDVSGMDDPAGSRRDGAGRGPESEARDETRVRGPERGRLTNPWASARWLPCRDGKTRPIPPEPEIFPLAHGIPNRVGALRGAGNAIVPQVAAAFIQAYLETV